MGLRGGGGGGGLALSLRSWSLELVSDSIVVQSRSWRLLELSCLTTIVVVVGEVYCVQCSKLCGCCFVKDVSASMVTADRQKWSKLPLLLAVGFQGCLAVWIQFEAQSFQLQARQTPGVLVTIIIHFVSVGSPSHIRNQHCTSVHAACCRKMRICQRPSRASTVSSVTVSLPIENGLRLLSSRFWKFCWAGLVGSLLSTQNRLDRNDFIVQRLHVEVAKMSPIQGQGYIRIGNDAPHMHCY